MEKKTYINIVTTLKANANKVYFVGKCINL